MATKNKTHSGAKKRFKKAGKNGLKRARAYMNHIKTKMKQKRKRQLRKCVAVNDADLPRMKKLLNIK